MSPAVQVTRFQQAERIADYLAKHSNSTAKEIDAACDTDAFQKCCLL